MVPVCLTVTLVGVSFVQRLRFGHLGPKDFEENLLGLVKQLGILGHLDSDKETEMILSSVSSLIVVVPPESAVTIVEEMCKQVSSESFQGLGWSSNVSLFLSSFSCCIVFSILQTLCL